MNSTELNEINNILVDCKQHYGDATKKILRRKHLVDYVLAHSDELISSKVVFSDRVRFILTGKVKQSYWAIHYGNKQQQAVHWENQGIILFEEDGRLRLIDLSIAPPSMEKITCECCGEKIGQITHTHLRRCCGITLEQYKTDYPNSLTVTEQTRSKAQQGALLQNRVTAK